MYGTTLTVESNEEGGAALAASIVKESGFELLIECLHRFGKESSPEEAAAVNGVLGCVENIVEIRPEAASEFCDKTPLLKWLLRRVAPKRAIDNNKLVAAEVLTVLLQSNDANRARLGELGGVEALLKAVAPYKSKDPSDEGEEEMVANLFDALSACVMERSNRDAFLECEGLELMLLVIKSKRSSRTAAIKCVDYALTRCVPACERFVDALGLKTIFSVFMGKGHEKMRKRAGGAEAVAEEEERAV